MKLWLPQMLLAVWFLGALFYVGWLLPPIFLLAFGDLWEVSPSHFILQGLTSTGGFVMALYALTVLLIGAALLKIAKGQKQEPSAGYQIFIYVSGLSYVVPILEGVVGSCTVSSDFSGIHVDCQSGVLAVLPALLASTVLVVAAVALCKFASSDTGSTLTDA